MVKIKKGDFLIDEHNVWRIDFVASDVVYVGQQWKSNQSQAPQNDKMSRGRIRHYIASGHFKHVPKEKANSIKVLYG